MISLYEASVASYLQTLNAVAGFLDKGLSHFRDNHIDPEEIVESSLFPDMRPFRFQIQNVFLHSVIGTEALTTGRFQRPGPVGSEDYAGLQAMIASARDKLEEISPREINTRSGADVVFKMQDGERVFTAEGFLLSFSLPNFYFHATTAYDILRLKGVPLGKRDFMGALRLKS